MTGSFDHLVFHRGRFAAAWRDRFGGFIAGETAPSISVLGALAAVKHASPHIATDGSIVLTTGIAALRPRSGWAFAECLRRNGSAQRALAVELAAIARETPCHPD